MTRKVTRAGPTDHSIRNVSTTGKQTRKRDSKLKRKATSPKIPSKIANGPTSEDLENRECNVPNLSIICLVCGNCSHELVDLAQNQELSKMIMTYVGLPPEYLRSNVKFVCVQCILKMQLCQEMKSNTKEKIKRAIETKTEPSRKKDKQEVIKRATEENKTLSPRSSDMPTGPSENQSMLDVFYERNEPVLMTESGGKVNKYKLDDQYVRSVPEEMICKNCERKYQRKYFYLKHTRRCRSGPVSSDKSNNNNNSSSNKRSLFHCNVCAVSVESQQKLRDHKLVHLDRLHCPTCGIQFHAPQAYEFHCAECSAKQTIVAKSTTACPPVSSGRRITRSQSRALSLAATQFDTSHPSIISCQQKSTNLNNSDSGINHDNHRSHKEDDDVLYVSSEEEVEEEDAVSVTDTMYTNRMRYTDNWLENYSINTNDLFLQTLDEEYLQINSAKEYDLYQLDRLKMFVMLESFPCFVPGCKFLGDSHFKLMKHEFCDHGQMLLYRCKKCGNNFTKKVHLDFHLYCQNGGRYICFKCGDVFEFQDQLDRHLICHTKSVNYRCNYCKFEFLAKADLLEHCELENHDPNGQRKLISIYPSMTIVNHVPKVSSNSKQYRQYKEYIMEMKLPKPAKRAPHQKYIRRKLQVGDIKFKGQIHPNCSSCILYV